MNRFLACLLVLSSGILAAGEVKIESPWIRAVPPSASATAAFMTIVNGGDKPVVITGAGSPVSAEVKPMITTKSGDGVMGMEFVEKFEVPAHGKRVLEPGGDHIMLMKLKEVPRAGSVVPLTLRIESGGKTGEIQLEVPVR